MFVFSVKTTRRHLAAFGVVFALLAAATFGWRGAAQSIGAPVVGTAKVTPVSYLQSLGYEVDPQWVQVREIVIPAEADETLMAYNAMQKETGFDLLAYAGERVKCWTYTVQNYPGEQAVQARVYMHKDRIVGGDISATAAGGFSHGLRPLTPTATPPEGEENGTIG